MKLAILLPPLATAEEVAEADRAAAALREEGHDLVITTEDELRAAHPIPEPLELPADLLANLNRDFPPPRTDRAWRRKRTR